MIHGTPPPPWLFGGLMFADPPTLAHRTTHRLSHQPFSSCVPMRARAPPRSTGLLNGHYDKHGGKAMHCRNRTLAKVGGSLFLVTWLWGLYRYSGPSSSAATSKSKGWLPGLGLAGGIAQQISGNEDEQGERHSRHKRHKPAAPVCTASPLQDMEAFPLYGCDELDVSAKPSRPCTHLVCPSNLLIYSRRCEPRQECNVEFRSCRASHCL